MVLWGCTISFVCGLLMSFSVLRIIFINRLKVQREQLKEAERVVWSEVQSQWNHQLMSPPASALGLCELIERRWCILINSFSIHRDRGTDNYEHINEMEQMKYVEFKMLHETLSKLVEESRKIIRENEHRQFNNES